MRTYYVILGIVLVLFCLGAKCRGYRPPPQHTPTYCRDLVLEPEAWETASVQAESNLKDRDEWYPEESMHGIRHYREMTSVLVRPDGGIGCVSVEGVGR